MNVQGHHHANGHVNGRRVHDRGRLRADGRDRGRRHVYVHRRARDRGHLCAGDHGHVNGRANDHADVGDDVHVHGSVHHHCSTASCFW